MNVILTIIIVTTWALVLSALLKYLFLGKRSVTVENQIFNMSELTAKQLVRVFEKIKQELKKGPKD